MQDMKIRDMKLHLQDKTRLPSNLIVATFGHVTNTAVTLSDPL